MSIKAIVRIIIVDNLEQSVNFYESIFGFSRTDYFEGNDLELSAVTQLNDVHLHAQMMEDKNGVKIELVQFQQPECYGSRISEKIDHYGLTHLAFFVDNVDETCGKVIAAGGLIHENTRTDLPVLDTTLDGMFVSDPNGVRIEIVGGADESARFLWHGICVRNLAESIAYYKTIGFEPEEAFDYREPQDWVAHLNEIKGVRLIGQVIRDKQGNAIELIDIQEPQPRDEGKVRDYNRFGLANMAFFVDDRDATGAQLQASGGEMFDDTRVNFRGLKQWHGIDPNGARVELVQHQ